MIWVTSAQVHTLESEIDIAPQIHIFAPEYETHIGIFEHIGAFLESIVWYGNKGCGVFKRGIQN